jgi:hypothetical protein
MAPRFLKSFFATLETGWSGFLASSEINVVEEVQSSRICRDTMGDEDEVFMIEPLGSGLLGMRMNSDF